MKILFICMAVFLLSGCSKDDKTMRESHMTQPISTETAETPPEESGVQPEDDLLTQYCRIKAEKKAVEMDIEELEAEYRIGKLEEGSFHSQKSELKTQKEELERKKEAAGESLPDQGFSAQELTGQETIQELLESLRQTELDQDGLELEEDQLENEYRKGSLERSEFIQRQTAIELKDFQLDQREDWLEDALERLGWDD